MPALPGMTKARAESLLDLIEAESKLEKSQFAGVQVSDRPFTPRDIELGREIFAGTVALKNGGPSCLSCHGAHGIAGFGGGTLAPAHVARAPSRPAATSTTHDSTVSRATSTSACASSPTCTAV